MSPRRGHRILRPNHIMKNPRVSNMIPALTIDNIGTIPEPYTIALGGVDTGSIKPKLAPRHPPKAGGIGETPAAWDTAIITGMTILAEAVFDIASLTSIPRTIDSAVTPHNPSTPATSVSLAPMTLATPVSNINFPRLNPPPKSMIVPQSIFTALSHFMPN